MCGITGFLGLDDSGLLKGMCDVMSHRGPDDKGYYTDGFIGLGNRRLSIIDIQGGKQPIHNETEDVWTVYNGELYNFLELRQELENLGHRFYTNVDTEVLVHAYEEYGEEFVKKLNGMFSIAIWDTKKKKLFLYRDHVGIKPLYYYYDKKSNIFFFASEIKSLLKYDEYTPSVSKTALHNYLSFRYTLFHETLFSNIFKLEPGNYITLDQNGMDIKQWWDMSFSDSGTINDLEQALVKSVKGQLLSDVPLGLFLSGGIDSTSIAVTMNELNYNIKSFTIGFPQDGESVEAKQTSELLNTDHHEIFLDEEDYTLLPDMTYYNDEPVGNVTSLAMYRLSQEATKHVKVALNGTGGDELLGGYITHKIGMVNQKVQFIPSPLRSVAKIVGHLPGKERTNKAIVHGLTSKSPLVASLKVQEILDEGEKSKLCLSTPNINSIDIISQRMSSKTSGLNLLLYSDTKTYLVDDLLHTTDKMTMAHGLEGRVPLLDMNMINAATSLPTNMKIRGTTEKYALRKIMEKKTSAAKRKKNPFKMPINTFFKKGINEIASNLLSEKNIKQNGYFDPTVVNNMIQRHATGEKFYSYKLFNILSFVIWHKIFIENEKLKL